MTDWKDLYEKFKNKQLGKDQMQIIKKGIADDYNSNPDLQKLVLGVGDFYQDLRTVEGEEKYNPLNYLTATTLRAIEGAGWLVDQTAGRFLKDTIHNTLRVDPSVAEVGSEAVQMFAAPKAISKGINLLNKGIASQKAHNLAYKAGKTARRFKDRLGSVPTTAYDDAIGIFELPSEEFQALSKLSKQPGINSLTLARRFQLQKKALEKKYGKRPDSDLQMMASGSMGDLGTGDVGIPGIKKTTRRKITTPEFIDKRFIDYGFTKKGPNGGWIFDEKVYNAKKPDGTYVLNDNQRREIIQIFQTDIDQTVPYSFTQEKNVKNLAFNEEYVAYNKKYGARAELHHDFPSALSAKFYFGLEYMSDEWRQMTALANQFGNYPGQPMTEGKSNLVTLPSKIGSNHPNYHVVRERFGNVPPHIHNIMHSQFYANETGMSGDKFFTPARVNKMNKSFEDRMEVFTEWNKIVARNRDLWNEGLKQLDVFFGQVPKDYHDDLVRMLEEYLEKGMITMGKGKVKDRFGDLVKTPDGKLAEANYAQFSVQDIVNNALADFKADFRNDILGKNPRFKEALTEVSNFSQLNQSEIDDMANVLYKIKQYNGLRLVVGTRRAGEMVFGKGQNVKYYNELLELYMGLIDDALPNDTPTIVTLEQLKDTTFKDFKKPSLMKQLEMIFSYD